MSVFNNLQPLIDAMVNFGITVKDLDASINAITQNTPAPETEWGIRAQATAETESPNENEFQKFFGETLYDE